ncbi:TPA: hypothetical protein ACH3X1_016734 [Trebouxia sp. C0004]
MRCECMHAGASACHNCTALAVDQSPHHITLGNALHNSKAYKPKTSSTNQLQKQHLTVRETLYLKSYSYWFESFLITVNKDKNRLLSSITHCQPQIRGVNTA